MGKRPKNQGRRENRGGSAPAPAPAPAATTFADDAAPTTPRPQAGPEVAPRRGSTAPLRPHVIAAIFARDFTGYFSNLAGYVFITLFMLVGAWFAFCQPAFFANNLANLDVLNGYMPYLLLFFIPAITMGIWAEERRQGTDELLLTLPARDIEVVLGKYLAALGIYTVALLFSTYFIGILAWLGAPDPGVMAATYVGYWLMGAMLIAVGMVASLLTSNATVAFILGAVFAAIPVFAGTVGSLFSSSTWLAQGLGVSGGDQLQRLIDGLSAPSRFRDFGTGVVSLASVVYFVSWAAAMVYLTIVLLGRRHWAGGRRSRTLWVDSTVRVLSVALALISLNVLVERHFNPRLDVSAAQLTSLSPESKKVIRELKADRPVIIQAYYSPEVPREFVQVKSDLLNKLREYAALAGDKVRLNLVEAERYSEAARAAEKRFGIEARQVASIEGDRQTASEIYLGVAFTSGLEEVVIPFFDPGLPVEYELTRSIRVVSGAGRKKVGILNTDAKLMGGFDMRSMGSNSEWSIVTELKKQYDVTTVSADTPIPSDLQALLVAQPSSLTQRQIDNLTAYVRGGGPTLLLLDPLPTTDPSLAPEEPRVSPGGMFGGGPQPEPKGDLTPLLDLLGISWPASKIVWNEYNPHPKLDMLPPEVVFIGQGSGAADAFNSKESVAAGLQEVVMLFPGQIRAKGGHDAPDFIPLLRTNDAGGDLEYQEAVTRGIMGVSGFNPRRAHIPSGETYTLAARIQGKLPAAADADDPKDAAKKDKAKAPKAKPAEARVIAIADLDLISEEFFRLRRNRAENLDFDNVTFVLNCVDVLAGDEEFVGLRKRRPRHRTLEALERQVKVYEQQRLQKEKEAEAEAKQKLKTAQDRLNERVDEIRKQKGLDERTRDIMIEQVQAVENRRLDNEIKVAIEDEKRREIQQSKAESEQAIRRKQNEVKAVAISFFPLLPLILGMGVFGVRLGRENQGASPNRLA